MDKLRVGVLRGGPSNEYEVSLKTGAAVLQNLDQDKYVPLDVLIDKKGQWHMRGKPLEVRQVLGQLDVAFNAMHGEFGEDGTVQKILSYHGTPYTGSQAVPSAISMNKLLTKRGVEPYAENMGIKLARHEVLVDKDNLDEQLHDIFSRFPQPIVVKPMSCGSSVGVSIAQGYSELEHAVENAFRLSSQVLLEEYVKGREATCGVLEGFRDEEYYALLPVEIIPPRDHRFFDYGAKYSGKTQELCPGNFSVEEKQRLQRAAREVHRALGLRHYSRADFILSSRGLYFLEVNTLPGLTPASLVPKSLSAAGCLFPQFLDHLLMLALTR